MGLRESADISRTEIAFLEILIRRPVETHFLMKVSSIIPANRIALSLLLRSRIICFRSSIDS